MLQVLGLELELELVLALDQAQDRALVSVGSRLCKPNPHSFHKMDSAD